MSIFTRLFAPRRDDRAHLRALWHRVVAIAREPHWYADGGIADTFTGRFDAITLVLSLVLLRMEVDPTLSVETARLTELFVADIDAQLRESGIGDPALGKRMGKVMEALGGRLGAYREALSVRDPALLEAAVRRNVSFREDGGDPAGVASEARLLADRLAALDSRRLLAGEAAR